jgi:hypothetical protein
LIVVIETSEARDSALWLRRILLGQNLLEAEMGWQRHGAPCGRRFINR